jgi:uncharacterized membrane protein YoaK (UPF0700 family)
MKASLDLQTPARGPAEGSAGHHLVSPAFEHAAFPVGLGFVAGFVDIFGFMALLGLLPAHVTGNLIFLAVDIAQGHYDVIMKIAALPIFALSVGVSAWLIGTLGARGRHPFLPMILLQAAVLGLCLIAGLLLPPPITSGDGTVVVIGSMMLFAMALQNTIMRLILNNLPSTTIMTGNITHMVAEGVRLLAGFGAAMTPTETATLGRRAHRISLAILSFTLGAIAGGLAQMHVGYIGLLAPIAALLALLPIGRSELHAAPRF